MTSRATSYRWLAHLWLGAVVLVVFLAWRQGPSFDTSILSLLPESEQDPLAQRASDQVGRDFSERLLVVVSGEDDAALRDAVVRLAGALETLPFVDSVEWRLDDARLARFFDGSWLPVQIGTIFST